MSVLRFGNAHFLIITEIKNVCQYLLQICFFFYNILTNGLTEFYIASQLLVCFFCDIIILVVICDTFRTTVFPTVGLSLSLVKTTENDP